MLYSENAKKLAYVINYFCNWQETWSSAKLSWQLSEKYVNFIFAFIQRKHFGVHYDPSKGIPLNGSWCVEDTVESYQFYIFIVFEENYT